MNLDNISRKEAIKYIKRLDVSARVADFFKNQHRNMRGERMRLDTFPHMRELYEEANLADHIVIMGGSQIGKTDWLIISILAMAYCGLNVFFILPKADMRDSYVQEKVLRPISLSPEYQAILKDSVSKKVGQIQFGHGMIKFVGGGSEADMTSFSADVFVVDETDKVPNPKNIALGLSRISGSVHYIQRYVSNPTDEKGVIFKKYEKSDKRVRKCPCDKCGTYSELDWFSSVVKEIEDDEGNIVHRVLRDTEWQPGDTQDIQIKCPIYGCNGNLDRLSESCYWQATAVSEQGIIGYHMPSLISPIVEVTTLWYEYQDALTNPSKMSAFWSMRLALPYSQSGHKVSEGVLIRCQDEDYTFELFPDCAYEKYTIDTECVMGIDTGTESFDISITTKDGDKDRLVYLGKVNPQNGLHFLHDLVDRYNVQCAVIDIGGEPLAAIDFQNTAKCTVWRCKFQGIGERRDLKYNDNDGIVTIDRTECLDIAYTQMRKAKLILPKNYELVLEGAFSKEMKTLTRVFTEDKNGRPKYKWEGPKPDHARLADAYRTLAAETNDTVLITSDSIYIG